MENQLLNVEELKLVPVNYKGEVVITTDILAKVYESEINNIQQNFIRNKDKFIESKHYILLQGEQLKEFKSQLTESQSPIEINKFASSLYLWTERGASRHCKMLDTDKAWERFDELENTYFNVRKIGLTEEQQLQLAVMNAKDKQDAILACKALDDYRQSTIKQQQELLVEQGNNIQMYNDFMGKDGLYSVDTVSKVFGIKNLGKNNMYKYLRDKDYIMTDTYIKNGKQHSGVNHFKPKAQYVNQLGYFKARIRTIQIGNKEINQNVVMFTAKGISWFYKKLQKENYIIEKDLDTIINELKVENDK